MTRRAAGSNQYRTRTGTDLALPSADLMQQVDDQRLRCGKVWGNACQVWVQAPDYSHPHHGVNSQLSRRVGNPNCSPLALEIVSRRASTRSVLCRVAAHPNSSANTLRALARINDEPVLGVLAGNPNCPPDVFELLAQSSMRWQLVGNPSCPPELLAQLLGDHDPIVRREALRNPNLPSEYRQLHRVVQ
jgi:hypothetical protein